MRHRPPPHIADRAVAALRRHGLVWLLLLLLPLHGLSAALIGLLGQRHFHEVAPSHAMGRVLWQSEGDAVNAVSGDAHAHAHTVAQRHHHRAEDATVVSLDPLQADEAVAEAGASSAAPSMLAPPPGFGLTVRAAGHLPWSARHTGWFVSWSSQPPERPPKA